MFSNLTQQFNAPLNVLYALQQDFQKRGKPFIDLISGNVNTGGLIFPEATLREILRRAQTKAKTYRPDPLGQSSARQAIQRYYAHEGAVLFPNQIVLTPGTSLSYWYLFKILANPNDEILCPTPSYPLFESIAALAGVKVVPYRIVHEDRWAIDVAHLASQITSRTRAIVMISPHNPTGAIATEQELTAIGRLATKHQLPVLFDEVFCPFSLQGNPFERPGPQEFPLIFLLNGFSKMLALPGMKIGWIAVQGKKTLVQQALKGLELISDTFLPVNEVAQAAVAEVLKQGRGFLKTYQMAIRQRAALTVTLLSKNPALTVPFPEGGFHLIVWHPGEKSDEQIALDLLQKEGVLMHPGYFYDLDPGCLVLTFVQRPEVLRRGLAKIARYFS